MKLFDITITEKDWIQISLNVLAFLFLIFATGGHGSFWGFATFNIIAAIAFTEVSLSKTDKTAYWVWFTKTVTYFIICMKFFSNKGELKTEYIVMISIAAVGFFVSRHFAQRAISMWGQVAAYIIGAYMYINAIINHPGDFGWGHMGFWTVNFISYALLIWEVWKHKKESYNYIVPVYAIITCPVFVILMMIYGK